MTNHMNNNKLCNQPFNQEVDTGHILHACVFVLLGPLNQVCFNHNYNQLHSMQPTLLEFQSSLCYIKYMYLILCSGVLAPDTAFCAPARDARSRDLALGAELLTPLYRASHYLTAIAAK